MKTNQNPPPVVASIRVAALLMSCVMVLGGAGPSATDLWEVDGGTIITGTSGIRDGFDARDAFGGRYSWGEPGNSTIFSDSEPAGFVHYLEWQTPTAVLLGSVALFAVGDGDVYQNEREFDHFRLLAKSPGSGEYDLILVTYTPTHPYQFEDAEGSLLFHVEVGPVVAQKFRAEMVQFNAGRGFDGPRVIELDGFPPVSATLPPPGLVAWWRGEGDGEDTTGGNDGELVGDVGFEDGYVGQAFRFDGQSGRVAVPASASLNVSGLTVEAWINPGDVSVQRPIVEYALEEGHAGVHLWHSVARPMGSGSEPGTLFANVRGEDGQNRFVVSDAGLIAPDEWSHVALTYDEATGVGRLYVNGSSVTEEFLGTFVPQTSMPLHLGYRPIWSADGGAENPFLGLMDEVAIYGRALSAEEIGKIYAAGREGKSREGLVTLTTVAGAGGTVERMPDLGYYSPGTPVVLTALAEPGFTFVEWAGDVTGTANPLMIEVTRHVTLSAVFAELGPERILRVVEPAPRQEGQRIAVPLVLSSGGDVGGMTFVLRYDSEYLARPELAWTSESGLGLTEVNVETPGEVHGTFALPGVVLPAGDQRLARVTFRARSVPETLRTPLEVEVFDVSNAHGDPLIGRTRVEGNEATILARRLVGDNNANHRLDVGDATVIQRLLIGLDPVRSWDVSGNDVNESGALDSGDVIRVLRAAAGIDSQPLPQSVSEEDGRTSLVKQDLEVANSALPGVVRLVAPVLRASPGETITVQVRLDEMNVPISAVAMRLDYPVEALRLASGGGHRLGDLVPESAVAVWNVGQENDYGVETGSLLLCASSAREWPSANGVLAEITFQVQEGQTAQRQWPISLSAVELTPDGFELFALQEATVHFIGRDPFPPLIDVPSMGLTSEGFELNVTGEAGAVYIVEASTDLIEWVPVADFMGTGDPVLVRDVDTTAHGQRFYRVRPE